MNRRKGNKQKGILYNYMFMVCRSQTPKAVTKDAGLKVLYLVVTRIAQIMYYAVGMSGSYVKTSYRPCIDVVERISVRLYKLRAMKRSSEPASSCSIENLKFFLNEPEVRTSVYSLRTLSGCSFTICSNLLRLCVKHSQGENSFCKLMIWFMLESSMTECLYLFLINLL